MNEKICKTCFTKKCKECLYVYFRGRAYITQLRKEANDG